MTAVEPVALATGKWHFGLTCRGCGRNLRRDDALCDLGALPLANALLTEDDLDKPEIHYPLRPLVCRDCLLVQLPDVAEPEAIFTDSYPFYAGQSATWVAHCGEFARQAVHRFKLDPTSYVLDIGSNDGTMLAPFRDRGISALGIEPSAGPAHHALEDGVATIVDWWSPRLAQRLRADDYRADLVIATNVLAHVPDLTGFLAAVCDVLAPGGTAVFEVPYVGNMLADGQFDQIYAEHHFYFGFRSLGNALVEAGLAPYDVEPLSTHGGSVRVYAHRIGDGIPQGENGVRWSRALSEERDQGLDYVDTYLKWAEVPQQAKRTAWSHLIEVVRERQRYKPGAVVRVAGYGASAKAAVTLNYFGMGPETIEFIADTTPNKWGKYLPGVRIPIRTPEALEATEPDVVVLLAWNWAEEAVPKIRAACPDARIVMLRAPWSVATAKVAA